MNIRTCHFNILILIGLVFFCLPTISSAETIDEAVKLNVPYTSEAPAGKFVKPWNNACEEASIAMVEEYFFGNTTMSKNAAIQKMNLLFKTENKIFGSNANTDAAHTVKLINEYTDFSATLKINPTLEKIKNELRSRHPVITFNYGKNIPNKNYRWYAGGSYYHTLVLVGFDDTTKEFITNDSGDNKTGAFHRYKYETIMSSLHDYVFKTKKANGVPTVAFTTSKVLMKEKNNPAVYLVSHDVKQPIADATTFVKHGWKWKNIHVVDKKTLNKFETTEMITG